MLNFYGMVRCVVCGHNVCVSQGHRCAAEIITKPTFTTWSMSDKEVAFRDERIIETQDCARIQWSTFCFARDFKSDKAQQHVEEQLAEGLSDIFYAGVSFHMLRRFHTIRLEENCSVMSSHYPKWKTIFPLMYGPKSAVLMLETNGC